MQKGLIPGQHKFTDEERKKAGQTKKINSALGTIIKKARGFDAPESEKAMLEALGFSESEMTVGAVIAAKALIQAMAGDKDARAWISKICGDDPEIIVKREELKLKKLEAEHRYPDNPDYEDTSFIDQQVLKYSGPENDNANTDD